MAGSQYISSDYPTSGALDQGIAPGTTVTAVPIHLSSGVVSNTAALVTMPAVAGRTNYVTGIEIMGAGATAAALVVATLTGTRGGTQSYLFSATADVNNERSIRQEFTKPIPASAPGTAVTLALPALGVGNTGAIVAIHGYVI